jgi:predicted amidohydrolase
MQKSLHLTVLQADPVWERPSENLALFSKLISNLGPTDLILLPEMFSTGFSMSPYSLAEPLAGPAVTWMKEQAAHTNAAIAGSIILKDKGNYYNSLLFVMPDARVFRYDKRHLFRMAGEEQAYTPGTSRCIVEYLGWRICPLICYDLRFPVWSRNRNDYDLLVYHANWPAARNEVWETLLKARALENQAYVAGINRCGTDGNGIGYIGNSMILNAKAEIQAHAGNASGIALQSALSAEKLIQFREKFPVLKDADAFEIKPGY